MVRRRMLWETDPMAGPWQLGPQGTQSLAEVVTSMHGPAAVVQSPTSPFELLRTCCESLSQVATAGNLATVVWAEPPTQSAFGGGEAPLGYPAPACLPACQSPDSKQTQSYSTRPCPCRATIPSFPNFPGCQAYVME